MVDLLPSLALCRTRETLWLLLWQSTICGFKSTLSELLQENEVHLRVRVLGHISNLAEHQIKQGPRHVLNSICDEAIDDSHGLFMLSLLALPNKINNLLSQSSFLAEETQHRRCTFKNLRMSSVSEQSFCDFLFHQPIFQRFCVEILSRSDLYSSCANYVGERFGLEATFCLILSSLSFNRVSGSNSLNKLSNVTHTLKSLLKKVCLKELRCKR